ncbi:hypothetical protein [Kamptonema sp. UHCC 0994]|uniref:hypothetical protein n=1 Tax=Kamptonema sp. UHCC 0994 TaxID=3031329 RepID=UPI0023BAB857|nr:hypothetical protein [Kamptonema sp. UHCC 0994]MDF0556237.1 hypothetical protein [Kamptonema sp. UHCC 0994]
MSFQWDRPNFVGRSIPVYKLWERLHEIYCRNASPLLFNWVGTTFNYQLPITNYQLPITNSQFITLVE